MDNEISQRLTPIFHKLFKDRSLVLKPDLTADQVERWTSLRHMKLIVAIEKEFNIRFSAGEVEGFASVGDLVNLISERTAI